MNGSDSDLGNIWSGRKALSWSCPAAGLETHANGLTCILRSISAFRVERRALTFLFTFRYLEGFGTELLLYKNEYKKSSWKKAVLNISFLRILECSSRCEHFYSFQLIYQVIFQHVQTNWNRTSHCLIWSLF